MRLWLSIPFTQLLLTCLCALVPATVFAADCNSNGIDDTIDLSSGTSRDCNTNSIPDECDVEPQGLTISSSFEIVIKSGGSSSTLTRIADFNGDTKPDILTADLDALTISVVLNINGASFGAPIEEQFGMSPGTAAIRGVEIADLDHDGDLDYLYAVEIGTAAPSTSTLLFRAGRNDGGGVFTPVAITATGLSDIHDFSHFAMAVGDLNGDNVPDILFSNGDTSYTGSSAGGLPFQYSEQMSGKWW